MGLGTDAGYRGAVVLGIGSVGVVGMAAGVGIGKGYGEAVGFWPETVVEGWASGGLWG